MKLKKIIPVIVFVIAAVAVFNINTNKEKPMAITESLSSSPIFIEDVNINKEIATAYKRNLDSLPESMTQYATSITITTENLSEKFNLNLNANILAITYGTDIYINDSEYNENVLIHELFHAYDYHNDWISTSDEFMKIYEAEKEFIKVSDGNTQNVYEFWASAGEMYYFNEEELKEIAPLTYNFMKEHIEF